ncbi:creatininase family protein [bacterium]|nr:creatininase family protein [Rhodopirellula sp.]MDB4416454.1 creatininase family protein [bacterium]
MEKQMASDARPWLLAECNYGYVKNADIRVAVIPLGATEPHNLHLPYGTDLYEATAIGERICEAAFRRGAAVSLLPTIPFGVQTNMRKLPLAMNVNPATLDLLLTDLVDSLFNSGIEKIVLLNSHGGNDFKPLLRTLAGRNQTVFLCDWFKMVQDVYSTIFEHPEDHAGEMETSIALAYFPHLVATGDDGSLMADEGATRESRFNALNQGWVQITRRWDLLTTNTGSGYPHAATAEKGEQVMALICDRLSQFLWELSGSQLDNDFPFAESNG